MAASLVIEEESGTSQGWTHPHNGYYAGDFSGREPWHSAGPAEGSGPGSASRERS
jgi:hypothetical protein